MIQIYKTDSNGTIIVENGNYILTDEFLNVFNVNNSQYMRMPSYVQQYSKFGKLAKYFSNYIYQAISIINTILDGLNINSLSGDILKKVLQRFDISTETLIGQDNTDGVLQSRFKMLGIKRMSKARLADYTSALNEILDIVNFEVIDYSCINNDSPTAMVANFRSITGNSNVQKPDIQNYLIPNVTGVSFGSGYVFEYGGTVFYWDTSTSNNIPSEESVPTVETEGYTAEGWDEGKWA